MSGSGRRQTVAVLGAFCVLAVAGCSSGDPHPLTVSSSTVTAGLTSAPPGSLPDAAATAAAARALSLTGALHSYAFRASQRLSGGPGTQQTTLTGRAIRPGAVSYELTVGGKVQQVIKVGGRTYARVPPGTWRALTQPVGAIDPVVSLLPLLSALHDATLTGPVLRGQVPAAVLTTAGLAPTAAPGATGSLVTFTLDMTGRVTSVALHLMVKAGSRVLFLDERTSFSQFEGVRPIKAPAVA